MIEYRKDAVEYSYGIGGLICAIIISIIVFIHLDNDGDLVVVPIWLWWIMKPLLSLFIGLIPTGLIGCITAGMTYLVLLPFRNKIPWDRSSKSNKYISSSPQEEIIVSEPIESRYHILDL